MHISFKKMHKLNSFCVNFQFFFNEINACGSVNYIKIVPHPSAQWPSSSVSDHMLTWKELVSISDGRCVTEINFRLMQPIYKNLFSQSWDRQKINRRHSLILWKRGIRTRHLSEQQKGHIGSKWQSLDLNLGPPHSKFSAIVGWLKSHNSSLHFSSHCLKSMLIK